MTLYVTLTNSARATLVKLEAHLRMGGTDPADLLNNYLAGRQG
jgi:hypothetical protein